MSPQQTIAHYRITAKLGEGGMGEVWRATDTKLGRDVAIKVLPETFAQDADRMARFTREAQVLASLNHPNIAAIYGVEERALVMELAEGPTLAERIAQGAIPLDEALPIAKQIAEALEYAHERGVVHRDLKPANIKITPEGRVKVLDFGLAKAISAEPQAEACATVSPTLTMRATATGVIMGTAAYMSPEQARGHNVDKRADIWAFGVVLYEMVTGSQLFAEATISDTLASVLKEEPDWDRAPAKLRRLLRGCLEKDPKQRLRDIGDAWRLLEGETMLTAPSRSRLGWMIAACVLVIALFAVGFLHFRETPPEAAVIRTYIPPPAGTGFNFAGALSAVGPVALSPDGRRMTFSARAADGKNQLWLRSLDALTAQPLAGTEDAIHPFWSPDSRYIAFFAGGKLKKIDASGGPPVTLCDAPVGRGGTWNQAGVIVFTPQFSSLGLHRVSASGGVPAAMSLDATGRWPWFLPDGRHFLFSSGGTVRLGSLDSKESKVLVETVSDAVYSQGYIIYLREDTLMAQPFDLKRLALSGEAVPIAENVRSVGSQRRGVFAVSQNGLLVYQSSTGQGRSALLTWFDRNGKRLGTVGEPGDLVGVELSPDRKNVATSVLDPVSRTFDLWLYGVPKAVRTRFTFNASRNYPHAIWSPDGASMVFDSNRDGKFGLYRKASNLSGSEELLYTDEVLVVPTGWSPMRDLILYNRGGQRIYALPLSGERKPFQILPDAVAPVAAQFSPDGRWIVYGSGESQRTEIYIAPFPGPGGKVQVSTTGGLQPRWRSDGKEISYVAPDGRLMAVEVKVNGSSVEAGRAQPLFSGVPALVLGTSYDASPDGQRFLVAVQPEAAAPEPLTLVQNWTAGLKK